MPKDDICPVTQQWQGIRSLLEEEAAIDPAQFGWAVLDEGHVMPLAPVKGGEDRVDIGVEALSRGGAVWTSLR